MKPAFPPDFLARFSLGCLLLGGVENLRERDVRIAHDQNRAQQRVTQFVCPRPFREQGSSAQFYKDMVAMNLGTFVCRRANSSKYLGSRSHESVTTWRPKGAQYTLAAIEVDDS
jgi:hypothetical protein